MAASYSQSDIEKRLKCAVRHHGIAKTIANQVYLEQGRASSVSWSVGTESSGDAIVVSLAFKDEKGEALASRQNVKILILADANGDAFNTEDYTIAAGTNGALVELVADKVLECITEANGTLDISLTIAGAKTCYLAWVGPGGKLHVSPAVTHASGIGS